MSSKVVAFNSHRKLFEAIDMNSLDEIRKFLDAGMRVDQTDDEGLSLLMLASRERKPEIMAELIARGAPLEQRNHEGNTALVWAGMESHSEGLKLLIEAGANIYATDECGTSALHWSCVDELPDGEALACAKLLLEAGMPVDYQVKGGLTPLMEALSYGNLPMAEWLLHHGANINAFGQYDDMDPDGELMTALQNEIILNNTAGFSLGPNGEIIEGEPEDSSHIIQWIINHGALNLPMEDGQLTSDLARDHGLDEIAEQLEKLPTSVASIKKEPVRLRIVR